MWLGSLTIGSSGQADFSWTARSHIGSLRNAVFSKEENPRWIAPIFLIPARLTRSNAPIHKDRSGLTGFFTKTGTSTPCKASAISCTVKGFAVERAPTQRISTPAARASSTCFAVATSVEVSMPVSSLALFNHVKPTLPMPSNSPGRVLGFQIPARNTCALPVFAMRWAVDTTCSSVSALHGPAMTKGLPPVLIQELNGAMSNECFIIVVLNFCGFGKLIPSPCMLCFYFCFYFDERMIIKHAHF